jgi:Raf kinase inhibitor-like YbhB/YbcL family protein
MRRGYTRVWLALVFICVTALNGSGGDGMQLSSAAFKDGGKIPIQYVMPAAGGKNVSLPLSWQKAPQGTQSFALTIVDPHPVARNWVHWMAINIPAQTASLEEGASPHNLPAGTRELLNSFGSSGYGGPQPPGGTGDHPYVVTLYALSVQRLELPANTSLAAFNQAVAGKVLASATVTGLYGR